MMMMTSGRLDEKWNYRWLTKIYNLEKKSGEERTSRSLLCRVQENFENRFLFIWQRINLDGTGKSFTT